MTWMMPLEAGTSGVVDGGGAVDDDGAVDDGDVDVGAVDGLGGLAVEADGGGGIDFTGDDVVGEDVGEVGAGQQLLGGEAEVGEGGFEGVVGRCEDRERAFDPTGCRPGRRPARRRPGW